ncbi:MAG: HAMP domain-containing histidine kinase [Cohaesibacteraceae bacterium]|nr:HAMP domain-containing histidine kinase [Cohaesibacteraceae bacterium]
MKNTHSIAARLAIGLAFGTAILWAGAAAITLLVLQAELTESFDRTLRQSALRLLPLAMHDLHEREEGEQDELRISGLEDADKAFSYYVRDRNGKPILLSDDVAPEDVFANVRDGLSDIDGRRVLALTEPDSGYAIVLVEAGTHRQDIFIEAAIALFWPLAGLIPLIGFGIWASVRFALRPLKILRDQIAKRGTHNLNEIHTTNHPAELAPIAEEVDNLLKRLRAALDAERSFAASSAHELRTPIAGALAQIQQLMLELKDQNAKSRVAEVEFALKKLASQAERLLQLSRLDAGFARSGTINDLMPVLNLVVRDVQSDGMAQNRITLKIDPGADLRVAINLDAFAIALTNLLQNAIKHGAAATIVEVNVGPEKSIRVTNSGPSVDQLTLQKLGAPYVRGNTKASGSGLGLSIARTMMEQTGGTLYLRSPATDKVDGFEAELKW